MYPTDVLCRICSQPLLGGAEPSTGLQTTAPSQDICVLPYWVNTGRVDFPLPPQTWFLIELKLSQLRTATSITSRTDHNWQFTFNWAALSIRQSHVGAAPGRAPRVPSTHRLLLMMLLGIESQHEEQTDQKLGGCKLSKCLRPDRLPTEILPLGAIKAEASQAWDCWGGPTWPACLSGM